VIFWARLSSCCLVGLGIGRLKPFHSVVEVLGRMW